MIKAILTRILISISTVFIMITALLLLGVVYIAKLVLAVKYRRLL